MHHCRTDGICTLAAIKFAKEGHRIYWYEKNKTKLEKVIAEVKQQSNSEQVKGFVADFSVLEVVEQILKDE